MSEITLKQLYDNMLTHFDAIYGKLNDLKQEQTFMNAALRRIEADVNILKQDVSVLKQDVSVLKQKVSGLEEKVSALEERTERIEDKLDAHMRQPAHV